MRRLKTKEGKALDEALDVVIAKSGHSPEAITASSRSVAAPNSTVSAAFQPLFISGGSV